MEEISQEYNVSDGAENPSKVATKSDKYFLKNIRSHRGFIVRAKFT